MIQIGFKDLEVLIYITTPKSRLDVLIIRITFFTKETNSHFRTKSPYTRWNSCFKTKWYISKDFKSWTKN